MMGIFTFAQRAKKILESDSRLSSCVTVFEYDNVLKPTPLIKTRIALGIHRAVLSPMLCGGGRHGAYSLSVTVFVPLFNSASEVWKAFDVIADVLGSAFADCSMELSSLRIASGAEAYTGECIVTVKGVNENEAQ